MVRYMLEKMNNYLIIKNPITLEEHFGKILNIEKNHKKIKLQLVDENNTYHYSKNCDIEILIPVSNKLYHFISTITFIDVLDKIITIDYPENVDKEISRLHTRYDLNVALDIYLENHVIPSISYDISLGGIAFIVNEDVNLQGIISIKIKTEKLKDICFQINLIHFKHIKHDRKSFLVYSGEFCNTSNTDYICLHDFFTTIEGSSCIHISH